MALQVAAARRFALVKTALTEHWISFNALSSPLFFVPCCNFNVTSEAQTMGGGGKKTWLALIVWNHHYGQAPLYGKKGLFPPTLLVLAAVCFYVFPVKGRLWPGHTEFLKALEMPGSLLCLSFNSLMEVCCVTQVQFLNLGVQQESNNHKASL